MEITAQLCRQWRHSTCFESETLIYYKSKYIKQLSVGWTLTCIQMNKAIPQLRSYHPAERWIINSLRYSFHYWYLTEAA